MLRFEGGQRVVGLVEVVAVRELSVGEIDVVDRAGSLEPEVDADDLGVADMPGDGIGKLVVDKNLGAAAVGLRCEA